MPKCSIIRVGSGEGAVPPPQLEKEQNLTADHELLPKKKNTTN